MSSPMFDLPEHLQIGVDRNGNGPVLPTDPDYDHDECWCGKSDCKEYPEAR